MNRDSFDPWQAERIRDALRPGLGYLTRLRRRMERRGFVPSDPLFQMVSRAQDDLQALFVEVNYLACKSGVGRAERPKNPTT